MSKKSRFTLKIILLGVLMKVTGLNTPTASAQNSSEPEWDGSG